MYHFFDAITNTKGDALVGYFGKVIDPSTGNVISIYADDNATPIVSVSGIADTAKVDTDGNLSLYVMPGTYHLDIYGTDGVSFQRRVQNLPMGLDTITAPAGSSVSTRALLAAIANPVSGQSAILTEAGREGTFVFSSANLSAQVTADTAQGIYVAPSSDTTGASGAWVRKYNGPVFLEWFGGGVGAADNKAAFDAVATLFAAPFVQLQPGTYSFSQLSVTTVYTSILGAGRNSTTILITGTGGGAPAAGSNGGVLLAASQSSLSNLCLAFNNPLLQCLLNISHASGTGRITLNNVDLKPSGLTASQINCTAVCLGNLTEFLWTGGQIGLAPNFKQNMQLIGFVNGCKVEGVTFRPHAEDIPNSVFATANPLVDFNNASTQGLVFDNCTFEQGPNGAKVTGQGAVSFRDCYFGDGSAAVTFWTPSTAVVQGQIVIPSSSVTGSITTGTNSLTVSDASSLFIGQMLCVAGAGAAGANLSTWITALSGTTATLNDNASTTVAGANVFFAAQPYAGHGYLAKTAGTTGTAQPVFPTASGGEIADNTTTWREYGPCAWVDASSYSGLTSKNSVIVEGGMISTGGVGILAKKNGGNTGCVSVLGTRFFSTAYCGYFDGAFATNISGVHINSYNVGPFVFSAASGNCLNNSVSGIMSAAAQGIDTAVLTGTTSMGGTYSGTALSGTGKARFLNSSTLSGSLALPGALTVNGGYGTSYVLAQSAVQASHTGDTVLTTLATVPIPANAIGTNGRLRARINFSFTGTAGAKTLSIKIGGTVIRTATAAATHTCYMMEIDFANRNSASSQHTAVREMSSAAGAAVQATNAINTATAQNFTINASVANAADTVNLDSYDIVILNG